jgi:translation initiation factor 3 subunit E
MNTIQCGILETEDKRVYIKLTSFFLYQHKMAEKKIFDLTPVMVPYFDNHMIIPLLDFVKEVGLYEPEVVVRGKIKTLNATNLIDVIEDEYTNNPDIAELQTEFSCQKAILDDRRNAVFDKLDNPPEVVTKVAEFFANAELVQQLQELKASASNLIEFLSNNGLTTDALEKYYKYAKFKFECGVYEEADSMLGNYLSVVQNQQSSSALNAHWGQLACRILTARWEASLQGLNAVKELIDGRNIAPMDQLRQRAWVLHWGLFVHINQRDGADALVDFFSEKVYLQTLENLCPWLLRYYAAFVILSPNRRRTQLRDVLAEIQSMNYQYRDPITEFLESLYNQFDFDEAQLKLKECQELVKADFFLQIFIDKFMHEARVMICEMYCTINRRVDLHMLADKLQMTEEESEKWMVEMVRNSPVGSTTLDAKIDSSAKQVIMSTPSRMAHQLVIERTRDLTVRGANLGSTLSNLVVEQSLFLKNRYAM